MIPLLGGGGAVVQHLCGQHRLTLGQAGRQVGATGGVRGNWGKGTGKGRHQRGAPAAALALPCPARRRAVRRCLGGRLLVARVPAPTSGAFPDQPPKQPVFVTSLQWLTTLSRHSNTFSSGISSCLQAQMGSSDRPLDQGRRYALQVQARLQACSGYHSHRQHHAVRAAARQAAACSTHLRQTGSMTIATRSWRSWLSVGGHEGGGRGAHHRSASSCRHLSMSRGVVAEITRHEDAFQWP